MNFPPEVSAMLAEGLADAVTVAGFGLMAIVMIQAFRYMRSAMNEGTLVRDGNTYDLDEDYEKPIPGYVMHEGLRYKLRSEDAEEPFLPTDEEHAEAYRSEQMDEIDDAIWAGAVEASRVEFNGESEEGEDDPDYQEAVDQGYTGTPEEFENDHDWHDPGNGPFKP